MKGRLEVLAALRKDQANNLYYRVYVFIDQWTKLANKRKSTIWIKKLNPRILVA